MIWPNENYLHEILERSKAVVWTILNVAWQLALLLVLWAVALVTGIILATLPGSAYMIYKGIDETYKVPNWIRVTTDLMMVAVVFGVTILAIVIAWLRLGWFAAVILAACILKIFSMIGKAH